MTSIEHGDSCLGGISYSFGSSILFFKYEDNAIQTAKDIYEHFKKVEQEPVVIFEVGNDEIKQQKIECEI